MKKFYFGSLFAENLEAHKNLKNSKPYFGIEDEDKKNNPFLVLFYLFLGIFTFILIGKLVKLQIIEGKHNKLLSEGNRIAEITIPASRGVIFDRQGELLVRNVPLFREKIAEGKYKLITREEALINEVVNKKTVKFDIISGRAYPQSLEAAHIVGYIGEITKEELFQYNKDLVINSKKKYQNGDFIGKSGLENEYEKVLRGISGKELVEVDAKRNIIRTLGRIEPQSGADIYTSIDLSLQKVAYAALIKAVDNKLATIHGEVKGAVIVANPETAEILAMVSIPSYDPNVFVTYAKSGLDYQKILNILEDSEKPLFNRAIGGVYPPGSTFKIITAAAGLESGKITKELLIEDTGVIEIGSYKFPNWLYLKSGATDGLLNIVTAIKRSNDIFFYRTGEKLGLGRLDTYAKKFGLGNQLGIDLPGEASGLVPTDSWKRATIGDKWYLGDTYHLAIGQGYLLVTPLQVNSWTNVIASGGRLCRPHLIRNSKQILNSKNSNEEAYCQELGIKEETIKLIRQGMEEACQPGGTGWPLFNFSVGDPRGKNPKKINIACKTGTAEYGEILPNGQAKTHAWFTSYAPAEKPEISVTVLVEDGGEGSDVAAPIAKAIYEEWFKR